MHATSEITAGIYLDMSDEIYHGDPIEGGSLSSTFARALTNNVPAKARARFTGRKPTKAMNLGKAVHSHALGSGPELIVWEFDGRTKEGKAERAAAAPLLATEAAVAVTAAERDQITDMVTALHAHAEIRDILAASQAEVSGFWQEQGIWLRARYDLLSPKEPFDYKTTQDASRRGFSKALGSYGYHQQADFYLRGLRILGHAAGKKPLRFICQETEPPYLVQIHTPDDEAMTFAATLNDQAIATYKECKRTGIWPAYPDLHAEPTPLPNWYFYEHEQDTEIEVA